MGWRLREGGWLVVGGWTRGGEGRRAYVRERRLQGREMFVPLVHPPGHGQADFGEAVAVIEGEERRIHFLAVDLPHSDACFVKACPAEAVEAFCDVHDAAFAFFGGVPRSMLYDNTRLAVARISSATPPGSAPGPSPSCSRTTSSPAARALRRVRRAKVVIPYGCRTGSLSVLPC